MNTPDAIDDIFDILNAVRFDKNLRVVSAVVVEIGASVRATLDGPGRVEEDQLVGKINHFRVILALF